MQSRLIDIYFEYGPTGNDITAMTQSVTYPIRSLLLAEMRIRLISSHVSISSTIEIYPFPARPYAMSTGHLSKAYMPAVGPPQNFPVPANFACLEPPRLDHRVTSLCLGTVPWLPFKTSLASAKQRTSTTEYKLPLSTGETWDGWQHQAIDDVSPPGDKVPQTSENQLKLS